MQRMATVVLRSHGLAVALFTTRSIVAFASIVSRVSGAPAARFLRRSGRSRVANPSERSHQPHGSGGFAFRHCPQHYESLPGQPPHHGIDRNVLWPASSSKLASVLPPGSPRLPH